MGIHVVPACVVRGVGRLRGQQTHGGVEQDCVKSDVWREDKAVVVVEVVLVRLLIALSSPVTVSLLTCFCLPRRELVSGCLNL
ncbi:hypothetical protein E2C01_071344 [Portunus trituberculatus]|uniref:Uncharacterized protein n=1 Tax=Portunus trituberculatus TaxID=210409 RepID=A0A5B7I4V9_PORTR|nr:hypothetical protein [Portunus trituberculatus]